MAQTATDKLYLPYGINVNYKAGDYVIYNGTVYICTQDAPKGYTPHTLPLRWQRTLIQDQTVNMTSFLKALPGYDSTKIQVLLNDSGTLRWNEF